MQSIARSFYAQAAILGTTRRALPVLSTKFMAAPSFRGFATEVEVNKKEETTIDLDQRNKKLGVDTVFNEQKHAYVLTFPWNFQEIISDFDQKPVAAGSYWHKFVMNNAQYEINKVFREFHQACALPDYGMIDWVCEGRLSQYVKESVRRIQFHGLDIEMANLTVE